MNSNRYLAKRQGLFIKTYGCQMNVYEFRTAMRDVLRPLAYAPGWDGARSWLSLVVGFQYLSTSGKGDRKKSLFPKLRASSSGDEKKRPGGRIDQSLFARCGRPPGPKARN